ncbi:hypothetical protein E5163_14940 [Marinicauda algicola]|uniref:Uncharacterized protein n=1 Tax=Marinicauda algicola TaxID=2029849 RepID=A0A4S2GX68_9PROT|nr:hypothetical protein [Marinicauda algicola]TGY87362.1 hypothetical protein E5163_14940 [Marinicauda algicola]
MANEGTNLVDAAYAQAAINEVTRQREAALDQVVGLRLELQAQAGQIEALQAEIAALKDKLARARKSARKAREAARA